MKMQVQSVMKHVCFPFKTPFADSRQGLQTMLRRDQKWAHMGAKAGAHWAHTFDENPRAFRKVLQLRGQSLNTNCSASGDLLRVHSDANFDENPNAILRLVHWHWNVILAAMGCTSVAS